MEKRSEPPKGPRGVAERYEELRQLRKKIEQLLAASPVSLVRDPEVGHAKRDLMALRKIQDRLIVAALFVAMAALMARWVYGWKAEKVAELPRATRPMRQATGYRRASRTDRAKAR